MFKKRSYGLLLLLLIFSPFSSLLISNNNSLNLSRNNILSQHPLKAAIFPFPIPNIEPSGYISENNVTYKIECSYSIWTLNTPNNIKVFIPRIQDHSHPQFTGVAPIQISELINNESNINEYSGATYYFDEADAYNNSFDCYELKIFPASPQFIYTSEYNVTLFETEWNISINPTVVDYIPFALEDWYLNLTGTEEKLEVNNTDLISKSNEICNEKSTIVEKARAVQNWIIDNIEYEIVGQDQGALQTYLDGRGDCSDFTSLMITLLRIQGIPARRVLGLAFLDPETNFGKNNPINGDSWEYKLNSSTNTMKLHAWVEYYIPGYGWIQCDPTWGGDYFNRIDYLHLTTSIGSNYGPGIELDLPSMSEIPSYALILGYEPTFDNIRYDFSIKITVLDVQLSETENNIFQDNFWTFVAIFIVVSVVALITFVITKGKK
ncbi:MAG: transglutaminase-like domain-containing protein [Promethearchaeota archaeon]